MDTGQREQVKQVYLLGKVMGVSELAKALQDRMWDIFLKGEQVKSEDEAPAANPIDYAISISESTQHTLKKCMKLLEMEIINKLVEN